MTGIILTQSDTPIIGWIAQLLGILMDSIFNILDLVGMPNIGLSIIIFTIVMNLMMLPLTIRQQKFSKLSAKMNPEIQAVQAKYKNKKDNDSMMAMNQETREIYAKYGVSPTGSCLQLLIQMPILFSLYRVINAMPAYVTKIKESFQVLVDQLLSSEKGVDYLNNTIAYVKDSKNLEVSENFITSVKGANIYTGQVNNDLFINGASRLSELVENNDIAGLDVALNDGSLSYVQNTMIDILNKASNTELQLIANEFDLSKITYEGNYVISQLSASGDIIEKGLLDTYNNFLGLNIANSPSVMVAEALEAGAFLLVISAIIIPALSAITQWINIKLMPQPAQSTTPQSEQAETMASTMKTMNMFMPIMSAFFCYTLPSGLGLYWIAGSVVRSIQQVLINKHLDKVDLDKLIEKNKEKSAKKIEKMKVNQEKIQNYAAINAKKIENNPKNESNTKKIENVNLSQNTQKSKGGLAAKANMVKDYNEKNNK